MYNDQDDEISWNPVDWLSVRPTVHGDGKFLFTRVLQITYMQMGGNQTIDTPKKCHYKKTYKVV